MKWFVTIALAGLLLAPIQLPAQTFPINYQLQLQVRANTGGTAFNLPNGSTFNSVSPSLNNSGNVAVKVNTVGLTTSPGLWFGGHGAGSLVHNTSDTNAILSDPFLNNQNKVSFPRAASTSTADDGLYVYDNASGMTTHVTSGPLGATSYTNPKINDNGLVGMRVKFNTPQALETYNIAANSFVNYVTETAGDPNSRYSFLFAPAFNNSGKLAAESNINGQAATYKELRIWNSDGSSVLVASGDSNIGPMFYAMDNSISMNNLGRVAFTTRTSAASSTRRIVVGDGFAMTLFPTVSDGAGFTSIDSFAPSINDGESPSLVAFRGNDNQATPRDSVFVTNGTTFQRIIGVNDTLMTDTGLRTIGSLMGSVNINNVGDVAFGVQFTSGSGGGNAIYVAYATVAPTGAVSAKTHPAAGEFYVDLPFTGNPGVECRSGGAGGNHKVIVTFPTPVTLSSAAVTTGTGTVDSANASGNQITVNLSGVPDAQTIAITLSNVSNGSTSADIVIPMQLLVGDTNGNGAVNASDVSQTKSRISQPVDTTNFRSDVNVSGGINASDVSLVKSKIGN